jgi:hypothetical protein
MTDGLLYVLSEPGAVPEAEFHDWYDSEHLPPRISLDGVHSARRLQAIDAALPGWAAIYDIDLAVLDKPEYTVLRDQRSAREQSVLDRLATLDRRTYELVADSADDPGAAVATPALVIAVSLTVPADLEPELHAWYTDEHTPLLLDIPGWARIRRYRLLDGDAPRWLALHELTDAAALRSAGYRHATSTPRRAELMTEVTARERRTWTVHRTF